MLSPQSHFISPRAFFLSLRGFFVTPSPFFVIPSPLFVIPIPLFCHSEALAEEPPSHDQRGGASLSLVMTLWAWMPCYRSARQKRVVTPSPFLSFRAPFLSFRGVSRGTSTGMPRFARNDRKGLSPRALFFVAPSPFFVTPEPSFCLPEPFFCRPEPPFFVTPRRQPRGLPLFVSFY